MKPTDEQSAILEAFATEETVGVEALAGTGKTTTLEMLARSTQRGGTYLAFNRAVVNEAAQRFPMNVASRTVHALARARTGSIQSRLDAGRMTSTELARRLGTDKIVVQTPGRPRVLSAGFVASLAMKAIRKFCYSDAIVPGPEHVPYVEGIDERDADGNRTFVMNNKVANYVAEFLPDMWADLCDLDGRLPYSHDVYVKQFELGDPAVAGDFVLVDECQDLSPVMLSIIRKLAVKGHQIVLVGDSYQQLYEWRGAVNAFGLFDVDHHLYLTQSFRFGPAIADVANKILAEIGAPVSVRGLSSISSTLGPVGEPDVILSRSNAAAVSTMLLLMQTGQKPHLVGGGQDVMSFARAAIALQNGEWQGHPDLACFNSWEEVNAYVADDPQGDDLSLLVSLLNEYGAQIVLDALAGMPAEAAADVVLSTTHKAKGREWSQVRLAGDFHRGSKIDASEHRLLYVGATRAQHRLDVRLCEPLADLLGQDRRENAACGPI